MTPAEIIRKAIPKASDELCEDILWSRTSYPAGKLTAQVLYKAANRFLRAYKNKIRLCDLCDTEALPGYYNCITCAGLLLQVRRQQRAAQKRNSQSRSMEG